MSYIRESLTAGEKIYKITEYHWVYLVGSIISATLFTFVAFAVLFVGIIYHYFDPVKLMPWNIFQAAGELSIGEYLKGFWHINPLFRIGAFLLILLGLIQVGARLLVVATTEMAVTNRRVVFKRGWISRTVEEMRVNYIEGADVKQTVMGRLLNYGRISVSGTGSESIWYPRQTADPIGFKRALEAARNTVNDATVAQRPAMPQAEQQAAPPAPAPVASAQGNNQQSPPTMTMDSNVTYTQSVQPSTQEKKPSSIPPQNT